MTGIEFHVRGTPKAQPRPRARVVATAGLEAWAQIYTPDSARGWRGAVLTAARLAPGFPAEPWTGAVRVTIAAYFERPQRLCRRSDPDGPVRCVARPDADNLVKAIMDALTPPRGRAGDPPALAAARKRGYPWLDDAQVHLGAVDRWYAAKGCAPGVIVRIAPIDDAGH